MNVEDFVNMAEAHKVVPESYSCPVRLYSDVDGVSVLQFETMEAREAHRPHAKIDMLQAGYGEVKVRPLTVEWNSTATEALATYSRSSKVDFVWLTSWYWNAPRSLDPLFGIHSQGFLPWGQGKSDYTQIFKAVALAEDQKRNPCPFIWIDDVATTPSAVAYLKKEGIDIDNALIIQTDMVDGLVEKDIERIDYFLANHG